MVSSRSGFASIIARGDTNIEYPRDHRSWWSLLGAIILAGLLSRAGHTGFVLIDKYLGDALYAAMVYVIIRLTGRVDRVALWATVAMIAIESFQLTRIPAGMLGSTYLALRVCGRLLGTEFSVLDLMAYAVGICCIAAFDRARLPTTRGRS